MKTFLPKVLGIVILCICFFSTPQTVRAHSTPVFKTSVSLKDTSIDWILQSDTVGVKAFYRVSTCGLFPVVLIKFVNSNSNTVSVSWDNQFLIQGNTDPLVVGKGVITIQPGETTIGTCELSEYQQLIVRYAGLKPSDSIENFVFLKLQVSQ